MKRILFTGIALIVLLAACATAPQRHHEPLRVMTFNIRLDLPSDGPNRWTHRKAPVASMIRFHRADLVGLQEALPGQLDDLDSLLPGFGRVGVGRDANLGGEHSAILYRASRFEVLDNGTFWLSDTPAVAGSMGWDAAYPRIVTWAHLHDRATGARFFFVNTHLDHVGEIARRESANLLISRIDAIAGTRAAVVLTGDFNALVDSDPLRAIRNAGFRDAIEITAAPHHGPTSTWNGFGELEPGRRIDFILVRGPFEVLSHAILSDRFDGGWPSDHLPVLAEVLPAQN